MTNFSAIFFFFLLLHYSTLMNCSMREAFNMTHSNAIKFLLLPFSLSRCYIPLKWNCILTFSLSLTAWKFNFNFAHSRYHSFPLLSSFRHTQRYTHIFKMHKLLTFIVFCLIYVWHSTQPSVHNSYVWKLNLYLFLCCIQSCHIVKFFITNEMLTISLSSEHKGMQ